MPSPPNPSGSSTRSTYDLVLLLDTEAEQGARAGVIKDVKESISSSGELVRHDEWGKRELAYPIQHREQAEYHLLQFHPSGTGILSSLDRSLRIADEVLRFRIVKLRPGTPEPPDLRGHASSEHAGREHASAAPARPAEEHAAEAPVEQAPAEPEETPAPAEAAAQPEAEAEATGAEEGAPAAETA
jgi:small subunit ribosomal protein S6